MTDDSLHLIAAAVADSSVQAPESLCAAVSSVVSQRRYVMKVKRRWFVVAVGALFLLFGLGCLNYTEAEGLEHHRQQAMRYDLPAPSKGIFFGGVASTSVGAGLVGFGLGRTRAIDRT
jgi:hypothetical protein